MKRISSSPPLLCFALLCFVLHFPLVLPLACHPDRRAALFAARSGGIVATLIHSPIDGTTTRLLSQRQVQFPISIFQFPSCACGSGGEPSGLSLPHFLVSLF